jgi:hypothetical protein
MTQYISKSAVVAEIKKKIRTEQGYSSGDAECGYRDCAREILSFLDTLEVKEVDLEKEIQQHINDCLDIKFPTTDIKTIAKDVEYTARKFFELGLKA